MPSKAMKIEMIIKMRGKHEYECMNFRERGIVQFSPKKKKCVHVYVVVSIFKHGLITKVGVKQMP